jgi:transcriptional regulator with XRE-family HTH domain
MSVKTRLRQFLEAEGMKITEAAEKSGIPYRSMQNYLSGERDPGVEALTAMNTRLGVSVDWLLTGEGRMHRKSGDGLATETSREGAVLSLLRQLPDDDQQEIQLVAQSKKRLLDVKQQLEQVTTTLADLRAP